LIFWYCSFSLNVLRQAFSCDKVHHQISVAFLLEKVTDSYQVGVGQAGHDLCFLLKLLAQLGQGLVIQAWLGHHLFESDGDVQPCVPCSIDGAHSSLSQ